MAEFDPLINELDSLKKFRNYAQPHNCKEFLEKLDNFTLQFFSNPRNCKDQKMTNKILILTDNIDLFTCILENLFKEVFQIDFLLISNLQLYKSSNKILDLISYSSELNTKFCDEICKNNDLLDLLQNIIEKFKKPGLNATLSKHHIRILNHDIQILCNVLMNASTEKTAILDQMKFAESIYELLNLQYDSTKLRALLFLINVVSKHPTDNKIFIWLRIKDFTYLIQLLRKFLIDDSYETGTYLVIGLAKGFEKLSKFEELQKPLVDCGILDLLKELIENKSKYDEDIFKKYSLSILYNLAFNDENRKDINQKFADIISNLPQDNPSHFASSINKEKNKFKKETETEFTSESKTETFRMHRKSYFDILDGLNWILQDYPNISPFEKLSKNVEDTSERESHFLLSYSHSNKTIVMKIYEKLKNEGYKLWIDEYSINDDSNMMQAMTRAIEKSKAIIMFLSEEYQNSEFCKSEAQYAYKLNKPQIPVLLDEKYKPSGWLSFCTVGSIYINLTKMTIEKAVTLIVKQISVIDVKVNKEKISSPIHTRSKDNTTNETHAMISYCHENREFALKIYNELKAKGYKIWIDSHDWTPNLTLMEAMAQAVEQSLAVIVCISDCYKNSESCRTEAHYAIDKKKPIIPIIIEENYRPDGWLGICIAGKQYLNCTGKYSFEESMSMLAKQLNQFRNSRKESDTNKPMIVTGHAHSITDQSHTTAKNKVGDWTNQRVIEWFHKIGIKKLILFKSFFYLKGILGSNGKVITQDQSWNF